MNRFLKVIFVNLLSLIILLSSMIFAFAVSEREDNDNISVANTISVNQIISGYSDKNSDDDWYKFTLNADGYISITLNHEYGSTTQKIYLYTYDGSEKKEHLYKNVASESETQTTVKHGLKKGTYYLMIHSSAKGNGYSFSVNYEKSNYWEKEFNDNVAQATQIKVNSTYYGSRAPGKADEDYFKFTIANYSEIRLTLQHEYGIYDNTMCLYTYDGSSQEQILRKWVSKDTEQGSSDKIYLDTGTYYVKITGGTMEYSFIVECNNEIPTEPAITPPTEKEEPTTPKVPVVNRVETPSKNNENNADVTVSESKKEEVTTWTPIEEPEHPDGETYIYNNFYYSIYDSYIVIDYYFGDETEVVVPSEIDGMPVITLGTAAFENSKAQKITVPATIKNFGEDAFGQSDGQQRKIICESGSEAEKYAIDNNLTYETKEEVKPQSAQTDNVYETEKATSDNSKTIIIILVIVIAVLLVAICVGFAVLLIKNKKNKN